MNECFRRAGLRRALEMGHRTMPVSSAPVNIDVERNLAYREAEDCDARLNLLDIYRCRVRGEGPRRPVALFVHGGDWSGGSKLAVHGREGGMAHWFAMRGWVFVSMNFRLVQNPLSPDADIPDQVDDIAKAIKWMSINIRRYGGDPSRITLVGFSSGAHLAALLACDPVYLQRYRLTNSVIAQIICLDGAHFDVPLAIRMLAEQSLGLAHQDRRVRKLLRLMGEDEGRQRRLSPAGHPLATLAGTRFLLLSAGMQGGGGQAFTKVMNERFSIQLKLAGVPVQHRHFAALGHKDLLLMRDEDCRQCVDAFLVQGGD
ncbi:alpha/beta hydrolase [Thauera aromatica]|uniref:alpha/beta hydrolase n=1 Tax=Thauera aromatica TaxID=59405 RepID=UPI001FFC5D1A|nr:alpha/beta hydrolase [Thauera aromatica]MCK2094990.1 alpha/beta hydrolase [Thauera aromatica]